MIRIEDDEYTNILPFFKVAVEQAKLATCLRAKCGTVIVKDSKIIGVGYNSPPLNNDNNRTCNNIYDYSKKPKYDKTCCIHAEWRAVLDTCKNNPQNIEGSSLYFMRIDENGNFTDAGEPFCTVCSRLAMESGISKFILWNNNGADEYDISEYDQKSYGHYQ